MKRKATLAKEYISMLFWDCLLMSFNTVIPKDKRANWKKMRRESNALYRMLKIVIK